MAETVEHSTAQQVEVAKEFAQQVAGLTTKLMGLGMTENDVAQYACNQLVKLAAAIALNGYGNREQAATYLGNVTKFHLDRAVERKATSAAATELAERGGKLDG